MSLYVHVIYDANWLMIINDVLLYRQLVSVLALNYLRYVKILFPWFSIFYIFSYNFHILSMFPIYFPGFSIFSQGFPRHFFWCPPFRRRSWRRSFWSRPFTRQIEITQATGCSNVGPHAGSILWMGQRNPGKMLISGKHPIIYRDIDVHTLLIIIFKESQVGLQKAHLLKAYKWCNKPSINWRRISQPSTVCSYNF